MFEAIGVVCVFAVITLVLAGGIIAALMRWEGIKAKRRLKWFETVVLPTVVEIGAEPWVMVARYYLSRINDGGFYNNKTMILVFEAIYRYPHTAAMISLDKNNNVFLLERYRGRFAINDRMEVQAI